MFRLVVGLLRVRHIMLIHFIHNCATRPTHLSCHPTTGSWCHTLARHNDACICYGAMQSTLPSDKINQYNLHETQETYNRFDYFAAASTTTRFLFGTHSFLQWRGGRPGPAEKSASTNQSWSNIYPNRVQELARAPKEANDFTAVKHRDAERSTVNSAL